MHIPQALSLDQNNVTLCLTVFKFLVVCVLFFAFLDFFFGFFFFIFCFFVFFFRKIQKIQKYSKDEKVFKSKVSNNPVIVFSYNNFSF